MNTFSAYQYRRMGWLLMGLLISLGSAWAQSEEYYQPTLPSTQPGYWRLSTSLDKRSTIVSFFDRQDQLLYQETLAGYHLKPSGRTSDLLDEMLDHLVANRLVSAHLQGQLVPFPQNANPLKWNIKSERPDTTSLDVKNRIHCSINPAGVIRLNVLNPTGERLTIRLTDKQGRTLYENDTQQLEYYSRLNVSSLENGHFQLSILDEKRKVFCRFRLTKTTQAHFEVQTIAQDTYAKIGPY